MRIRFQTLLFLLFLWCFQAYSQTDKLPKLGSDSSIKSGILPNGVKYYFADNKSAKGLMDIALVQKMDPSLDDAALVDIARRRFASAAFKGLPIETFLSRNGILPGEKGYVEAEPGSIHYHFTDLASSRPEAVQDSLLLAVFNIAQHSAGEGQPSSSQALVFAGDFAQDKLLFKLKLFSILNENVPGSVGDGSYERQPGNGRPVFTVEDGPLSKESVTWRLARTPEEYMGTVLPVISDKMSGEMGWVLRNRLYQAFRSAGLHVWIQFNHINSTDGIGDERIVLSINCLRNIRAKVHDILETELNRLYTFGVDEIEYTYARDAYKYKWLADARSLHRSNSGYVDRCVSSFLYGASLSTEREKIKFAYRELPDSTQTRLFNNYVCQLLFQSSVKDESLSAAPPLVSRDSIAAIMDMYRPSYELKLPKDKEEYVTKGQIWTFANGVNVIYKKMDTQGMSYYCFASKGGRKYADPDYFDSIDGVYPENFANYLAVNGLEMKLELRPCDVRLKGKFPNERISEMIQVITALVNQPENDKVYSNGCYKLFVLVSDMDEIAVKKMFASFVVGFRPGGKWLSCKPFVEDKDIADMSDNAGAFSLNMPLDVSTYNLALSDVAVFALKDALGREFSGCGMSSFLHYGFAGSPSNRYSIGGGMRNVPLRHFVPDEEHLTEAQVNDRVARVIFSLKVDAIAPAALAAYKGLAKNAFESYSKTPEYFIEIACDRYLDNKDLRSKYSSSVDAVTSESIRKFYASASAAD